MVVIRKKKTHKHRGKSSHGWGSKKKHRGSGSRGGVGFAGSLKHKYSLILTKHKDHFQHRGFKRHGTSNEENVLNLRDLDREFSDKTEINLQEAGYDKLLGSGKVTKAYIVKGNVTPKAKEKIEAAGGQIVE